MRIARRISLSFLVATVVLTVSGLAAAYVAVERTVRANVSRTLLGLAHSKAEALATYIEEERKNVLFLAGHSSVIDLLESRTGDPRRAEALADVRDVVGAVLELDPDLVGISLTDSLGSVVLSSRGSENRSKGTPRRAHTGGAGEGSRLRIGFDETLDEPVLCITTPVVSNGRVIGFASVEHESDHLLVMMRGGAGLGGGGEAYLADQDGLVLVSSRVRGGALPGTGVAKVAETPPGSHGVGEHCAAPAAQRGETEVELAGRARAPRPYENYMGVEVLGTQIRVPGTDWLLFVEIEQEAVLAFLKPLRITIVLLVLVIPPVAWRIGWRVSRCVSEPLGELQQAADKIGSGDLSCRTGVNSNDEVGELGFALDSMAENLSRATATIDELQEEVERRTRAEADLRSSERKYRSLVDNIDIGIALINPEMRLLSINNKMKEWFPKADAPTGPLCYEAFNDPPKTEVCSYCPAIRTLLDGRVHEAVSQTLTADGVKHFRIVSSPITDDVGKVKAVIEAVEDVTELKRYHNSLAERVRYEMLVSNISSRLVKWSGDGFDREIEVILADVAAFFGADRALISIVGPSEAEVSVSYSWVSKEGPAGTPTLRGDSVVELPNLLELLRTQEGFVFRKPDELPSDWREEREIIAAMGVASGVAVPLVVGGEFRGHLALHAFSAVDWPRGVVSRLMPITVNLMQAMARREADAALADRVVELRRARDDLQRERDRARMYLDVAGVMMIVLDGEGRVAIINKKGCELLGYGENEIVGRDWFDLVVSPSASENQKAAYSSIMAGESELPDVFEHWVVTKSGRERLIFWRTTILRDESGEAAGLLASGEDITDRRKMETELIRLERLRALGEIAAGVSHNLNNILVGVLGHAQLLRASLEDGEAIEELDNVLSAAKRAEALVEDLRRAVSADQAEKPEPVLLEAAIREAIRETRPRWKDERAAAGGPIDVQCRVGELPPVKATASGMHDVLVNLILNAVDAMPDGGAISIEGELLDGHVEIEVADTGEGMDESTRRRVFEPFFTTKAAVGTGLGLATVHNDVSRWGGTIDVSSAPGEGTTFRIALPVWDGPAPADEKRERRHPCCEAVGGRVLIVDDEELVRGVLKGVLSPHYDVDGAADAAEALKLFAPERYDVAVVDLGLPSMPGDKLAAALRVSDPLLATVLVTGWKIADLDPRLSSFDLRIMKPFADLEEIERVVRQAMELHRDRATAPEGERLAGAGEGSQG